MQGVLIVCVKMAGDESVREIGEDGDEIDVKSSSDC
jgi:hypothetical protein